MDKQTRLVEAIDEGRIVSVSEEYALREGLPILRKPAMVIKQEIKKEVTERDFAGKERSQFFGIDSFRRPWRKRNNVIESLIDNFHWQISAKRRQLNLTRKKMAESLNVSEDDIKLIENGVLPKDDFILINKIQDYLKINLRRDGQNFNESMAKMAVESRSNSDVKSSESRKKENTESILGDDIKLIE